MIGMYYIVCVILGYLCGCFNVAYLMARRRGVHIHSVGNGNPGASNVALNYGIIASVLVGACDILKALIPGLLVRTLLPDLKYAVVIITCAVVLGHMFPFYMKFKGGKGFASYIGMCFALDWRVAFVILLIAIGVAFMVDYIVAATCVVTIASPFAMYIMSYDLVASFIMCGVTAIILYKHLPNFGNMVNGTEPYLSSAFKKPAKR